MKKEHGGKRSNAGRKPIGDKAVTLSIYPRSSWVSALGKDRAKAIALQAIKDAYLAQKNTL